MCFKGELVIFAVVATVLVVVTPLLAENRFSKGKVRTTEAIKTNSVKATLMDNSTAVVKFSDRTIHPLKVSSYSQQFQTFIRKFGESRTKIVLTLIDPKVEFFKHTLSGIFFDAVAGENIIRERENRTIIKVFMHMPAKSLYDRKGPSNMEGLKVALANYIEKDGVVSGVIFESSLIQTPIFMEGDVSGNEVNEAIKWTVVKFKKFLKSLQLTFGHEIKMGLSLSSYEECIACFMSDVNEMISSFDMVVLNASFMEYFEAAEGNGKRDAYFRNCINFLQRKYKQMDFYDVVEVFDFKN